MGKRIHLVNSTLTGNIYSVCGIDRKDNPNWHGTRIRRDVTCKSCKNTRVFRYGKDS